jgi:hypothetical protein
MNFKSELYQSNSAFMDWGMERYFGSVKEQARPMEKENAIWCTFTWTKKPIV